MIVTHNVCFAMFPVESRFGCHAVVTAHLGRLIWITPLECGVADTIAAPFAAPASGKTWIYRPTCAQVIAALPLLRKP